MRMASGTRSQISPVAHSAAASLRPTPAPNAPSQPWWVVWLSAPRIICPGRMRASSPTTWWQMPRPASKKWRMPCSRTNARISAWLRAWTAVGAGTAWSRVMMRRLGSRTRVAPMRRKMRAMAALLSWLRTRSGRTVTIWPTATWSSPAARAMAFWVKVRGVMVQPQDGVW